MKEASYKKFFEIKRKTLLTKAKTSAIILKRNKERRHGQVVRQRSATPLPPVQIWVSPPKQRTDPCGRFFVLWRYHDLKCALQTAVKQNSVHIPTRRSASSLVRRRSRESSPKANTWVSPPKKQPVRVAFFIYCVAIVYHQPGGLYLIKGGLPPLYIITL